MQGSELRINSQVWWEDYFQAKWDGNHGREQTRHFMTRMVAALPWLLRERLSRGPSSLIDWGCAFGDGADVLASAFPLGDVTGYDFAPRAVAEARKAYPRLRFALAGEDRLAPPYDAVFCSNCLEHFEDPVAVAADHMQLTESFYALLVPYDERVLCEYHSVP